MITKAELKKLIEDLILANREYFLLAYDDDEITLEFRAPASPEQILTLERLLGSPLPPSYKMFLELHNGSPYFSGELNLLSVEEQKAEWVKETLNMLSMAFDEIKKENPFENGAIPVLLGNYEPSFLIVDPRTVRPDGEMDFVEFYYGEEINRFKDFTSFLYHKLESQNQLIEKEKYGIPDDEEDEDELE